MKKKLILLFLFAFLIRLIAINQSLWLDEGITARVISQYNLFEIVKFFSVYDFHPPLYYFLTYIFTQVFGTSESALRMPSIIFSLFSGLYIFKTGKLLKSKNIGFWSAAFFLFNPLIVYYSQEARMYMMTVFLLCAGFYYYIKVLKQKQLKDILLCNTLLFLSFLTFYGSIFFILTMYIYLLIKKKIKTLLLILPGFILSLLIISPLLYSQLLHSREALVIVKNWDLVLGKATIKNLLLIPIKFSIGRISFYPKEIYYAISILWTLILSFIVVKAGKKSKKLIYFFITPLLIGFIFSCFTPLLLYFRFIYLIFILSLLLSIGTSKTWQRIFILSGFCIFTFSYLLFPSFHREDWKALAKEIPKDKRVVIIASSSDAIRYYIPDLKVIDLISFKSLNTKDKELIIIPYTSEIYGIDYSFLLKEKGYMHTKTKNLRGLSYEVWNKQGF